MNAASPAIDHYLAEFAAVEPQLPGNEVTWLAQSRKGAIARFAELGFPTSRHEDWKYTRLTALEKRAYHVGGETCLGLTTDDIAPYCVPGMQCHRLVFVNGRYAPPLSSPGLLPAGVRIVSLASALAKSPEELEPHLGRYANPGAHGFSALNAAFMGDGAYVHLARGAVVELPIHLLFLSTSQDGDVFTHPRTLIVAEEQAEAAVIESYASLGEPAYFTNALTEVALAPNARVDHYKLQRESTKAFHIATLQVRQDRDSRFTSHSVSLGGQLVRNDINVVLDAPGADCTLNGLYMAEGRQHVDYHTRIDHAKPHGTSKEVYKGVLGGRARGVFNGRVYVHPDAQKTDAQQSNSNLLLSRDAEVDTKPQLEIYADDVKCAHGATVGRLDEQMVFYLRSRGIDQGAARALLTYAFAHDVIDQMKIAPVRESLQSHIVSKLPDAAQLKGLVT